MYFLGFISVSSLRRFGSEKPAALYRSRLPGLKDFAGTAIASYMLPVRHIIFFTASEAAQEVLGSTACQV